MGLSKTKSFWVVGLILLGCFFVYTVFFTKVIFSGGRRKRLRLRQIKKKASLKSI